MTRPWHPCRKAIGAMLARVFPVMWSDDEAREGRKLLRLIETRERLK